MFLPHKLPSSQQQTSGRSLREPLEMQRRMKVVCSHASKAFRCPSLGQREFLGWFSSPIKDVPLQINNSILTGKEACTCSHNKGECPHSHVEELWSVCLYPLNESTNTCLCTQKRNKLLSLIPQLHFLLVWGCFRGQGPMFVLQTSQNWDLKRGFLLLVSVGVSLHQEGGESHKHRGTHGNSHTTLVINHLSDMVWTRHKQRHIFHTCRHMDVVLCMRS